jgi:FtsP/CotA-like multicopper oxidase with cupredoxin domain
MIARRQIGRRDFLCLAGLGAYALAARPVLAASRAASAPQALADLDLELRAAPAMASLLPGRATSTWAYAARVLAGEQSRVTPMAAGYLGPVIRARRGETLRVRFVNELEEPSIVHWHGLHVAAAMDGHPRDAVGSGATYLYEFPIIDRAGTYWYHPHPHGRTGVQVYNGLAGVLVVSDDEEEAAGLPTGEYDLPLVIQDRSFDGANQFLYGGPGAAGRMDGVLGDTILVNGRANSRLDLKTSVYRLRLVNGSNSRIYKLAWSDATPLVVIATDGGLLEAPVERPYVMLAPGERVELLADFRRHRKGATVRMVSLGFSGADSGGLMGGAPLSNGVEFPVFGVRVRRRERRAFTMPARLSTILRHRLEDAANAARPRRLELAMDHHAGWTINGRTFEMDEVAPDEVVRLGTLEAWDVVNVSAGMHAMGMAHPFHLHGFQFQVVEREVDRRFEAGWRSVSGGFVDDGWKDTVLVMPGERVRLLVRFADFQGTYVYHCHNLEHADGGMMRNFRVAG